MGMYPEQAEVINDIQRSKPLKRSHTTGFVCKAIQEYYKTLQQVGAVKSNKEKEKEREKEKKEAEKAAKKAEEKVKKEADKARKEAEKKAKEEAKKNK